MVNPTNPRMRIVRDDNPDYYEGAKGAYLSEINRRNFREQTSADQRGQTELHSDPELSQLQYASNLGRKGGLESGKIVYAQPYTNSYRVSLDDMDADIPCCRLSETACQPFSARDNVTLPANTNVLCWISEEAQYGVILGVIPPKVEDPGLVFPDWVSQGSNTGFKKDAYYLELLQLCVEDGGMIDFSNSRPVDGLSGTWGRFTDLGGGIHLDQFMSFMRQSEHCGLWLFYFDMLARLEGYNLDIRTAVSDRAVRNDEGEGYNVHRFSPYPWEALGAFQPGTTAYTENENENVQYDRGNSVGKIEPLFDDQAPIHRYEEFRGYLGQGFMRHLKALPTEKPGEGVHRYSSQLNFPGLFREQISIDGGYALASAHSIILEKRSLIPIPRQSHIPEDDGSGDNSENYRAAGTFGSGQPHDVGNMVVVDDENSADTESADAADFAAHAFHWKGMHPFHYHTNDFDVPDGQNSYAPFTTLQEPLGFSELLTQPTMQDPKAVPLNVDHRYGDVDYYERRAGIYLLPQGGVVIRGGAGEEIKLSGGNIQISCPGDTWLQPGRSAITYGGDDIILKANKSVDVTTAQNDIRLKAEQNLEMTAGNQGAGRLLLENKALGPVHPADGDVGEQIQGSGIVMKASNSDLITAVREMYLRTGGEQGGGSEEGSVLPGRIYLDAARGSQDVIMVAGAFQKHLNFEEVTAFPVAGEKQTVHTFGENACDLGSSLTINGSVIIVDNDGLNGIQMEGWINIKDGHIASTEAANYTAEEERDGKSRVYELKGKPKRQVEKNIDSERDQHEDAVERLTDTYQKDINDKFYSDEDQIGNAQFQRERMAFSLRTDEQMNTQNFVFFENYWQQLAMAGSDIPGTWQENPIVFNNTDMYPHPGSAWLSETWVTMSPEFFNGATGQEIPRGGEAYVDAEYPEQVSLVPDGNYPVVSSEGAVR